jgi:hypothetical protein
MISILTHEYALVLYGVLLWQVQQHFIHKIPARTRMNLIGRSMIWGGMLVVFDDEIADFLLEQDIDLYMGDGETIVWYFYIGIGFIIDLVRNKVTKT